MKVVTKPRTLILAGDGINCAQETALAFQKANALTTIMHINSLLTNKTILKKFQILVLPGGFSFGDDISSGQILALKLKYGLNEELHHFIENKNAVLGICNGFQALVKLGLLPVPFKPRVMTVTHNDSQTFQNRWVSLDLDPSSHCIWTKNMLTSQLPNDPSTSRTPAGRGATGRLDLPIRHAEGRVLFKKDKQDEIYRFLKERGQIPLTYAHPVNGSYKQIAGVCDPSGRIFGLMPHPEAAHAPFLYPSGKKSGHTGLDLIKSGVGFRGQC